MKIYILEHKAKHMDITLPAGVFATKQLASEAMQGEMVDYERMSDTEEYFETDEGDYFITEEEVIGA